MLRISKLTDYALVILTSLKEDDILSASIISQNNHIPLATTNKILKKLAKYKICGTKSGKMGGFYLSKPKNTISLLSVVQALEDKPTSLTQCINGICKISNHCNIQEKMNLIDKEINNILSKRFISDLI